MKWMILAAILLLLVSGCVQKSSGNAACINDKCFTVEIADTPEKLEQGLMNRQHLDDDRGMLFIFDEEGIYSFWMKDTKIPLDIIWISSSHEIVYISSYTQPCDPIRACPSITPPEKALYVLEVNAGEADGFWIGDSVDISI